MINRIWGSKIATTSGEWLRLILFIWALLTCSEGGGSKKCKMKIYISSGIQTHATIGKSAF